MNQLIHVLHLEDDPVDVELIQEKLEAAELTYQITHVKTRVEFDAALRLGRVLCIFDFVGEVSGERF